MKKLRASLFALSVVFAAGGLSADVIDDALLLQRVANEVLIDSLGGRWSPALAERLHSQYAGFRKTLTTPAAEQVWVALPPGRDAMETVREAAAVHARLQHAAAIEMLAAARAGDVERAKEWRALIAVPKYANALDGALALQEMGKHHSKEVMRLLAREYFLWQITRARAKADDLGRMVATKNPTDLQVAARMAEIEELSRFPGSLYDVLDLKAPAPVASGIDTILAAPDRVASLGAWRAAQGASYPNLLSPDDVAARERIVLKLLRLIPIEYQSGVRDGEIVIPIEYREAVSFTIEARRILAELISAWEASRRNVSADAAQRLFALMDDLEVAIANKAPLATIRDLSASVGTHLQDHFGLRLKRVGSGGDAATEAALEVRTLLGQSLAAALAGKWRQAEALRLEAYVNFDLDIEMRVMPREPSLALRAEKTFLDGQPGQPGIKSALDARLDGSELAAAYDRAIRAMEECVALCRVGLAPGAATVSATLIVLREGLEAVVILAALLAGLRGPDNAAIRRRIGLGAWLALAASAGLFAISRTLLSGLSRYGEILEAVISLIAVAILLMVTNWVFHKYYWTGWNARLRQLSKSATQPKSPWVESAALVGVGFMTIFREGFETTLFLQSLILEAGMAPALAGLAIGGALIAAMGFAVFFLGAKLPYRKMLVLTGVLVVFVLFTFVGSTVRILQTVGWLPIHPIPGLSLPQWMGVWLGLYPTFEGLLLPMLVFVYVGGAWLWVRFRSSVEVPQQTAERATA